MLLGLWPSTACAPLSLCSCTGKQIRACSSCIFWTVSRSPLSKARSPLLPLLSRSATLSYYLFLPRSLIHIFFFLPVGNTVLHRVSISTWAMAVIYFVTLWSETLILFPFRAWFHLESVFTQFEFHRFSCKVWERNKTEKCLPNAECSIGEVALIGSAIFEL